ncbi:MAG: alpha-(1-_3)-arabinofuranosyltransferase domain-containing protein [Acidimicrobiales bacterium]
MSDVAEAAPTGHRADDGHRDLPRGLPYLAIAAVIYLPLLVVNRGALNADTKQYLYLDPAGLMERARSLWDPVVGGGTVTHQTIGYLWPMGPYYWLADTIGLPDWVAQRLWVGSIMFVAAAGMFALLTRLMGRSSLHVVGALAYGLSPYVLGHITGQSALLLPFSALPWLVLFMYRACTEQGWRWPAAYALAVATCGSLNGSSVFFVVLGSSLLVPFLVRSSPEVSPRDGAIALARAAALTFVTQVWWLVGYAVGGSYGLPLLATTETFETTSTTTSATGIIRGLGYWFFYGADTTGPWLDGLAPAYIENAGLIGIGFVIPVVALAAGGSVWWLHRAYFSTVAAVGLVISVGAYSAAGRSPFGQAFFSAAERSDLVFSLRNTQRATPLVLLGLAGLLAAGLDVLRRHRPPVAIAAAGVAALVLAASFPHHWTTGLIAERFHRPDQLPDHWLDAADHLAAGDGRILELPGIDFAAYRWGNTLDPITPGLVDRPFLARELVPMGSAPGVDLLAALDRSIHEGHLDGDAIGPVARLLGASDVVVRSDLEFERYRTARPRLFWDEIVDGVLGLGPPSTFGEGYVNRADPAQPMLDEVELAIRPDLVDPPAVAVFPVLDPHPLVRLVSPGGGTIVAGDGAGVVAAAASGLLERDGPLRYATEVTRDPAALRRALTPDTRLVVTDTNRLRGQRWYSLRETVGAIEVPGQPAFAVRSDPGDARIPPIPDPDVGSQTVAEHRGAARIWATAYGNPITLTPEDRAVHAFDGDPLTAWTLEVPQFPGRHSIGIDLDQPSSAPEIQIRQAVGQPGFRAVLTVDVVLDGTRILRVDLDERSLAGDGQAIALDGEPFDRLEIRLIDVERGDGPTGFSTIAIPGVAVQEIVHLPTDLLTQVGADLADHDVAIVLTRARANPAEVVRSDPEVAMRRALDLPVALDLTVTGTARLSARAPEELIDELLGIAPADQGGLSARSRERLAGDLGHRASSAVDGDTDTAWRTPFGHQVGNWIEIESADPFSIDTLRLDLLTDGRHSVPREILVEVGDERGLLLAVPELADSTDPGSVTRVEIPIGATLSGTRIRIELIDVAERTTRDWYTGNAIPLPVGIAEIDLPGVQRPTPPEQFDGRCRDDLVFVDGAPIGVQITGSTEAARTRDALTLESCGDPLGLGTGESLIETSAGARGGIDVDRLVLRSRPDTVAGERSELPVVSWERPSATSITARVTDPGHDPFWLVVSESWNEGWSASLDGVDLGTPEVHDAFGMGWLVTPDGQSLAVEITWGPQRVASAAVVVSAIAALGCIALIVIGARGAAPSRRRHPRPAGTGRWPMAVVPVAFVVLLVVGSIPTAIGAAAVAAVGVVVPRARPLARLVPAALVALAGLYMVVQQLRWGFDAGFDAPANFARVHYVALAGPVLLAVLSWVDRPPAPATGDDAHSPPPATDPTTPPPGRTPRH